MTTFDLDFVSNVFDALTMEDLTWSGRFGLVAELAARQGDQTAAATLAAMAVSLALEAKARELPVSQGAERPALRDFVVIPEAATGPRAMELPSSA